MPIVVDSSQWTGDAGREAPAGPIVWGVFADRAAAEQAAGRLQAEAWYQEAHPRPAKGAKDSGSETDRQSLRQNFVGASTASTSMLAAGIVIATGGAALPAVAAAAAAGLTTAAVGEAVGKAAEAGTGGADDAMRTEGTAIGVLAATDAVRSGAEAFFQRQGAGQIWVQEMPAA